MKDYQLGLERAAHECEWMARGYAAYLMTPLLEAAKRIREIPLDPKDEPHCQRRDGVEPGSESIIERAAEALFFREMQPFINSGAAEVNTWAECIAEYPTVAARHRAEAETVIKLVVGL